MEALLFLVSFAFTLTSIIFFLRLLLFYVSQDFNKINSFKPEFTELNYNISVIVLGMILLTLSVFGVIMTYGMLNP